MAELGALQHPAIIEIATGTCSSGHRTPLNRYPGITTVVEVIYHRDVRSTHTTVHVDRARSSEGKVLEPTWSEPENVWADKLKGIWMSHILDWLEHDTGVRLLIERSSLAAKTLTSWEEVFATGIDEFEFQFEEAPQACADQAAPKSAINPHQREPSSGQYIALSGIHSSPARLKLSQHAVATISSKSVLVGVHDVEVGHPLLCPSWGYVSVGNYIGSSRVFVPGALCTAALSNAKVSRIQDKAFSFVVILKTFLYTEVFYVVCH